MDPISMGMMALQLGGGVANYFGQKGKKMSSNLNLPSYAPSTYDASTAGRLNTTLADRMAGKNVGYDPADIATMNAQTVDQSARAANEYTNRAMAGRQLTGGATTGGSNLVREQALQYGGGLRSEGLRDVAIKNAVQKRQEINAAIPQSQTFLNDERQQAETLYNNQMQQAMLQKEEADKVQTYNAARQQSSNQNLSGLVGSLTSGYMNSAFPSSTTSGGSGVDIGKYLFGTGTSPSFGTGAGNLSSIGQWLATKYGPNAK